MDYIKLKGEVERINRSHLKSSRRKHVKRVAKLAKKIALAHYVNPHKAELAGLAHDMTRNWSKEKVLNYIEGKKFPLSEEELNNPYMLHGLAAALMFKYELGCKNEKIFEALRCHTTGRAYMCPLAKVVFIADYLEPGRKHVSRKWRKKLLNNDLDYMLKKIVKKMIKYQKEVGKEPHPWTEELYREIMKK